MQPAQGATARSWIRVLNALAVSGSGPEAEARSLNALLLTLCCICAAVFLIGIPFLFTHRTGATWAGLALALVTVTAWRLARRGAFRTASWLAVSGGWLVVTGVTLAAGGLGSIAPVGYLAVVTTAVWLLGRRGGLIFGAITAAAGFVIAVLPAWGVHLPRIFPFQGPASWIYLICAIAAAGLPVVLTMRDLEAALHQSTRLAAISDTIIDHIPGIFAQFDAEGRLLRSNARLSELTGLSPKQLSGRQPAAILAEQDHSVAQQTLSRCMAEGEAVQELSIRKADGSLAPYLIYGARVTLDGDPQMVIIGIDLIERRRAEHALRRFEERYRDFLERVGLAAVTVDLEAKLLFTNEYFDKLTGWARQELVGRPLLSLVEKGDRQKAIQALNLVLAGREDLTLLESRLMARDGRHRIVQWNLTPIMRPDGSVAGATLLGVDLTERYQLEAQLQQSQKLESLGRLAAGVAHDFNNILMIIGGFAEVLETSSGEETEQRLALNEIRKASERASALTRQLLAFSRKQVFAPQIVDLNALVKESERLLSRLLGAGVRVEMNLAPDPVLVVADAGQLHQVIMNLAVNSRDAMPAGGTLLLSTICGSGLHQFVVADTGHGMSQQVVDRAFEPFFTTKEPGEGSGLGLAMVYGIVEQSGGTIRLDSKPDEGTTVTISLPAAGGPAPSPTQTASEPERRRLRILLVEDEPGVRGLVALLLRDAGHVVIPAEDGAAALEEAEAVAFDFDTAVVDVVMPYMSGPDLVVRLRQRLPRLPVVFISGYSHTPPVEIQGSGGLTEYVQKPFKPEELHGAIHRVMAG